MLSGKNNNINSTAVGGKTPADRIEFLHKVTAFSGIFPGEKADSAGYLPYHMNDRYELIFFKSGTRSIRTERGSVLYTAGDVFLVRPNERYSVKVSDSMLDRYYIRIGKEIAEKDPTVRSLVKAVFERECGDEAPCNMVHLTGEAYDMFISLSDKADKTAHFGNPAVREAEILSYVYQLLACVANFLDGAFCPDRPELLMQILAYIDSSFGTIGSTNEICRVFFVSRSTLWRLFRLWMDETPAEYIARIRLERSVALLLEGCSVSEAASECGFCDLSHFISCFRKKYGITPHKFVVSRKKHTE